MRSRIYNIRNVGVSPLTNDFLTDYSSTYQNRWTYVLAMNKSYITNSTSWTVDSNYPIENLEDYSMYSYTRCNTVFVAGYNLYASGFRVLGNNGTITDGLVQFNKDGPFNQSNWSGYVYVFFRHKTDNTKYFGLRYSKPSTAMTILDPFNASGYGSGTDRHNILDISNCLSLKEGFFYFTQEHLKQLGYVRQENGDGYEDTSSFDLADYNITVELNCSANIKMEISNIFIGQAFDFYPNGSINFDNNNLNKYESSSRVGRTFQQTNKRLKTIAFSLNPFTAEKANNFIKSVAEYNKDFPFFFLPYTGEELAEAVGNIRYSPTTYLTDLQKNLQIRNLNQGGLYFFEEVDKLNNTKYNTFSIEVKMKEYK